MKDIPLNQIILGDALEVMLSLPDSCIDTVITDPPYGTTGIKWDVPIDLTIFWHEVNRVTRNTSVIAVCSAQPFTTDVINSNRKNFRYELIWEKTIASGFLSANSRPLRAHENILIFNRKSKGSTYNPQKTKGEPYKSKGGGRCEQYGDYRGTPTVNLGDRFPRSVLRFPTVQKMGHPTSKPLGLMRWLVNTYSNPGEIVLDPFMGSGTTAVACIEAERQYFGVEKMSEYINLANERIVKTR